MAPTSIQRMHLARAARRFAGKPARLSALAVFLGAHNGFALLFGLSAPPSSKGARFGDLIAWPAPPPSTRDAEPQHHLLSARRAKDGT